MVCEENKLETIKNLISIDAASIQTFYSMLGLFLPTYRLEIDVMGDCFIMAVEWRVA